MPFPFISFHAFPSILATGISLFPVHPGAGFALIFVSLATAGLSTIEKPLMTAAVGLFTVVRTLSGSIGIALAATFLAREKPGTGMCLWST